MSKIFIVIFGLCYIGGQVIRLQIGNVGVVLLDLAVMSVVGAWILSLVMRETKVRLLTHPTKLFLSFMLLGLVSLFFYSFNLESYQLFTALLYPLRLCVYLSLFFIIKMLSENNKIFIEKAIVGIGTVIVVMGFLQYFFYPYLRNLYYLGWDDHLYRLFSIFLDPNFAGAFFALFLVFILDKGLVVQNKRIRLFYGVIGGLTLLALYLTYSRTGFIMLLVGTGVYLSSRMSKKIIIGILAGLVCGFLLLANTKIEGLNPFRVASSSARIESAQNALTVFQQNPLLGIGFNAYRYAQSRLGLREELSAIPSHADATTDNSYLFVLATTGIIGFSIFVVFWYTTFRELRKMTSKGHYLSQSVFASLCSILIGSLFLNVMFYPMILGWVAIHAGLIRSK